MSESTPYSTPGANVADSATEFSEIKMLSASGRLGRVRYFGYTMALNILAFFILGIVFAIGAAMGEIGMIIAALVVSVLAIAITVIAILFGIQRLHDLGQSGWLYLLVLVPLVNFIFALYLLFAPGSAEGNQYGNPPPPNSGGVIAVAIIVPFLYIVLNGVLMAIAIPAYQGYIERAQQMQLEQQLNQ